MPAWLCLVALVITGCAPTVDCAYGHDITGRVVDAAGRGVPGVEVRRVAADGTDYGIDLIYRVTTDAGGAFTFAFHGLGRCGLPPTDDWDLVARATGAVSPRAHAVATWQCPDGPCSYVAGGVVLTMPGL